MHRVVCRILLLCFWGLPSEFDNGNVHLFSFCFVILARYLLFFFLIFSKNWLCFVAFIYYFSGFHSCCSYFVSSGTFWHWSGKERGWGAPHHCQVDFEVQVPHWRRTAPLCCWVETGGSPLILYWWEPYRSWWGWKCWVPIWPSLTQSQWACCGASLQSYEHGSLVLAFAVLGGGGAMMFSMMFSNCCLKVFCPARLPLPGPVAREKRLSLELFFVRTHWCFLVAGFFISQSGIYETKIKAREPTAVLFLGSQEPLASQPSSLHLSVASYVLVVLSRRDKAKHTYTIFLQRKYLQLLKTKWFNSGHMKT